jgi:N-acetylglucosamine-6-phosphate deacetylase
LVGLVSAPVTDLATRPYFGLIADDIHLSPSSVRAAWAIHEEGCVLTTDATAVTGLPDGTYDSRLGVRIVKKGKKLVIEGTDTVAGGYAHTMDFSDDHGLIYRAGPQHFYNVSTISFDGLEPMLPEP